MSEDRKHAQFVGFLITRDIHACLDVTKNCHGQRSHRVPVDYTQVTFFFAR